MHKSALLHEMDVVTMRLPANNGSRINYNIHTRYQYVNILLSNRLADPTARGLGSRICVCSSTASHCHDRGDNDTN